MFNNRLFMAQLAMKDKQLKDVADALGINRNTLYCKIKDNGRFTRSEITALVDFLEIDPDTMSQIFFAD